MKIIIQFISMVSVMVFLLFSFLGTPAGAVIVVYPEVSEPFKEAFEQMVVGIGLTAGEPVESKILLAISTGNDFQRLMEGERTPDEAVILLGQKALSFYEQRKVNRRSIIVGGVDILPGQLSLPGISLSVDPRLYLRMVRELLPRIKKVVIYYNARDQTWIDYIDKAALPEKISVVPVAVSDASAVASKLGDTLKSVDPETTVLWFGRDTIAYNTELLYPYILEKAWERRIAVISDTIAHVRRGFLFAFYPNYSEIGKELGTLIRQRHKQPASAFQWTQAGQLTLNLRTARHLGINVAPEMLQRAKPVFPEP